MFYIPVITAVPLTSTIASTTASSLLSAATTTPDATASDLSSSNNLPLRTTIDPAFGVLGAILVITGLPMAFYGHRNRWSSYFLAGFFALALICISIILKVGVEPAVNPPSRAIRGLFLVAALIAGAVGGIISIVFWRGAGLLACGLGGFFFGLFLQAVRPGGLIRPVGLRFILYIGFYAVFFTISCIERVHSLVLALATAIIGATALTLGIDCFSTQGLKEFYIRNLGFDSLFSDKYPPTFKNGHFPLVQGMQIELGVLGALVLMGFAFQMRLWSDLRAQLAVLKRSDTKRNMRSKAERAARAVARTAKRDLEAWEAQHGYKKTATRNVAGRDEELGLAPASPTEDKGSRSRTSSFMTLLRGNSEATPLPTPMSPMTEKPADSPAAASVLDTSAFPFPAQSAGRRNSQFLEYIQKGPERVEPEGPLRLDLPSITSPLGEVVPSAVAAPTPEAIPMSPITSVGAADTVAATRPTSVLASDHPNPLEMTRTGSTEAATGFGSFRQRSASTAALMDNAATFLDLAPPAGQSSGAQGAATMSKPEQGSQSPYATPSSIAGVDAAIGIQSQTPASHERTFSNPTATIPSMVGAAPMAKSASHQSQLQHDHGPGYTPPLSQVYTEQRHVAAAPQQSPLPSPGFGPVPTVSGGQSSAVVQARRSLAMRRSDQVATPWTNPGAEQSASAHRRASSAEASTRVRAMSIEELEARHRAKLSALQAPATQSVQEAVALSKAKEEWERKQRLERRRMQEREAQKAADAAAAAADLKMSGSASTGRVASPVQGSFDKISSTGPRDDRRRSRNLSATLLEAVGEEARESGGASGASRAAEWRKLISGLQQLDPRAARPSNSASPTSTRPTSPQPAPSLVRASPNPFPLQPQDSRKRLSETDRRRLSQGAGDRSRRRDSQPLLDFNLPHKNV